MLSLFFRVAGVLPFLFVLACDEPSSDAGDGGLLDGAGADGAGADGADAAVALDGGEVDLADVPPPIDLAGADLSPRMVQGRVLDYYEAPVPGASVSIGGVLATTDSSGAFTLMVAGGFYDVLVGLVQVAGQDMPGNSVVAQYVGLTRSDPILRLGTRVIKPVLARQATVSGTCTGVSTPLDAATNGNVWVGLDDASKSSYLGGATSLAFAGLVVRWNGAASQGTTVRGLFRKELGDGTFSIVGYGTAAITLNDNANTAVGNLVLTMPPTQNLTGTLIPVVGATSSFSTRVYVGTTFLGTASILTIPAGGAFSLPQPVIAGATIRFAATSAFNTSPFRYGTVSYEGLQPNAALGTVTIPNPGTAVPPTGAPNAVPRNADFALDGGGAVGAVKVFSFTAGNTQWQVISTAGSARFPDASALGVANPSSATVVKSTIHEHAFPTVDSVAGSISLVDPTKAVAAGQPYRMAVSSRSDFNFMD